MIILTENEKQWIRFCKGNLVDYPLKQGGWIENLIPLFTKVYGWNPLEDNNYDDYLRVIFSRLLDLYLKIKESWSDENGQLKDIFYASFYKGFAYNQESPIERAICKLCGLIQCNLVIDNGVIRYEI